MHHGHRVFATLVQIIGSSIVFLPCWCRLSAAADVQLRAEALQLLHHFLALPAGRLEQLSQHVEELANNMFPASSWEWKPGSTQSTDYARQLMALMDSMVAAAEQGLSVEPVLQVTHLGNVSRAGGGGRGMAGRGGGVGGWG